MTTRISTSVKPAVRPRRIRCRLQVPRPDVGIGARAAGLAVGAVRQDVDVALQARIQVVIRLSPRIARQFLEITAGLPVGRQRRIGRACVTSALRPCSVVG